MRGKWSFAGTFNYSIYGDLMFRDLISDTVFSLYMEDANVSWFKSVYDMESYKLNCQYLMEHPLVIDIKHYLYVMIIMGHLCGMRK